VLSTRALSVYGLICVVVTHILECEIIVIHARVCCDVVTLLVSLCVLENISVLSFSSAAGGAMPRNDAIRAVLAMKLETMEYMPTPNGGQFIGKNSGVVFAC